MRSMRLSLLRPSLRANAQRSLFTSARRNNAAVADVAESEEAEADRELAEHLARHDAQFSAAPKHGTVLYNWGAYPFYGLLGTTIISKELFILDHNFPAIGLFGATFFFFTWQLGPLVNKFVHGEQLAQEQERHDTFDLIFALMDRTTSQIHASNKTPQLVKEYVAEYKTVAAEAAEAEVRALKFEDYTAAIAQLDTLANQKAAESAAAADLTGAVLQEHLYNVFTSDDALTSQTVDEAIARLDPKYKGEGSIVEGVFDEYVKSGNFDVDRIVAKKKAQEEAAAKN